MNQINVSFAYRVALVDDHPIFREGFETILKRFPNITITGSYSNPLKMLAELPINTPQVIFMDIDMPELSGVHATEQAVAICPDVKVVALTQCSDGYTASMMFKAGASGYMTKTQVSDDLVTIFTRIGKGEKYLAAETAMEISMYSINGHSLKENVEKNKYTARELAIIKHIVDGKTDKEIGQILGISPKTVDKDKRDIMKIMKVNKATQIVAMAFKLKLVL